MPVDALPQPWSDPLPGRVRLRREFRDALGRPLTGSVTLTGSAGAVLGGVTVPPVAVAAPVDGGVLEVDLLPDAYRLEGVLRTREGARVTVRDEITLEASQ